MGNELNDATRAERRELKVLGQITLDPSGAAAGGAEGEAYLCNIINMSLTGALVECGHLVPVGTLISYSFRMPGGEAPVKVLAEVVRRDSGPARGLVDEGAPGTKEQGHGKREGLNMYGIRFLDMKDDVRHTIRGYIKD